MRKRWFWKVLIHPPSTARQLIVFPQLWMLISHRSPRPSLWGYGTDSFLKYLKLFWKRQGRRNVKFQFRPVRKKIVFWSLEKCMVWSNIYWDTRDDLQIWGSSFSLESQDIRKEVCEAVYTMEGHRSLVSAAKHSNGCI